MQLLYKSYLTTQENISMLEVEKSNLLDEYDKKKTKTNKLTIYSSIAVLGTSSLILVKSQPDFIYNISDALNDPLVAATIVLGSLSIVPTISFISFVKDLISNSNSYNKILSTISPKKYEQKQALLELKYLIQNVETEIELEKDKLYNLKEEIFEELPNYLENNSSKKVYKK